MKLSSIIMLLACAQISAKGYSQISISETDAPLQKVFRQLQKQSGYDFLCAYQLLQEAGKITVKVKNVSLEDALKECLKGTNLAYDIGKKTVIITRKERIPDLPAPPVDITGRVTDEKGEPLEGVTVSVKGVNKGTSTNGNGEFLLSGVDPHARLVFSSTNVETFETALNGRTKLTLMLKAKVSKMDEVAVIAYGSQKKLTLTGAVSSVSSADLVKSPSPSVANTLAGRVTGLTTVQYSGLPGGDDPRIFVRGIGSLSDANSTPLILVDGVERSFSQLDPNEIETISVLKDASATSVFGIRGANGVVIVTTKRGTEGKPRISMSGSTALQIPTRLPKMADSYTYATTYNQAQLNDDPNAVLRFSPEAIEAFRTNSDPIIYPNTDWMKKVMKPSALQSQENINISGGTKAVKYFVSLGYLNQGGLFNTFGSAYDYNFKYQRYNYRANVDIAVTNTTKLSLTTGGRSEVRNTPYYPNTTSWYPEALFYDVNNSVPFSGPGVINGRLIKSGNGYISGTKPDGLMNSYGTGFINTLSNVLNFDIALEQKLDFITKGLSFKVKAANNSRYDHSKSRSTSVAYYEPWRLKDKDPSAPNGDSIVYKKNGEDALLSYGESFSKARDWYLEGSLSYNRTFGDHHISSLLLYNESKIYYPGVNTDIPLSYVGLVGRATYDFRNKYLLDINMGYNGSENFAPGRRFGLFPAFSLGWILTQENFMKPVVFLDYLKLRGSYGIVGNDKQGSRRFLYLADSYLPNSGGYNFGTDVPSNQITATEGRVGNPMVSWETSRKRNLGLDMKMFRERLAITADVFDEYRNNILTTRQTVPGFIALDLPAVNIGIVKNRGYEIEIKWRDNVGSFSYFISSNMSFSRNKVIFKDEIPRKYDFLMQTGKRVNQPFGYTVDGFWSQKDIAHLSDFPDPLIPPKPGDLRYKDLNHDGIINSDDAGPIGYPEYPEYIFGTTLGGSFKNFDLSMLWTATQHVSRSLQSNFRQAFGTTLSYSLLQYMADGQWTPETGDHATYPRMSLTGVSNNVKNSDFWLKDASYIRLKNIELGYTFNIASLKRYGITRFRAYINGYNLLTFDNLKIVDPEANPGGMNTYPVMKIFNLGVNVMF